MTVELLENRISAVETAIIEIRNELKRSNSTPDSTSDWWETRSSYSSDEVGRMLDELEPYTKYIRQTGECPPPGWNPGDPIPEPAGSLEMSEL